MVQYHILKDCSQLVLKNGKSLDLIGENMFTVKIYMLQSILFHICHIMDYYV